MRSNIPSFKKAGAMLAVALLVCLSGEVALAHTNPEDLSKLSRSGIAWIYLKYGFLHILPYGFDHVLFVLSLFLLNSKLKPMIWQATTFTIAHSVTLGLSMYGVINPPAAIIEPIIALSIAFVAIENLITDQLNWWRTLIVFVFGLIHGCGFAGALGEMGLPPNEFLTSLVMFNVGVELGQLTVILAAYWLVGKWFGERKWYRQRVVYPTSALIAFVAFYWTIERVL